MYVLHDWIADVMSVQDRMGVNIIFKFVNVCLTCIFGEKIKSHEILKLSLVYLPRQEQDSTCTYIKQFKEGRNAFSLS